MRAFVVRHGQTSWNEAGIAQGHTDIPLDDFGLMQAEAIANELADARIGRILCSDLMRAQQSAQPLAKMIGKEIESTNLLRERCFGAWEGLPYGEITAQFQTAAKEANGDVNLVRAPGGGESFADLWDRLDSIVGELWDTRQNVVLVTHGGTCAVLLARLLQANLTTRQSFRFSNASITELCRNQDFFRMLRYNDTRHVEGLAQPAASNAATA